MSLWKIAWRSIQQRGLASSLTTVSMALGVMLVVSVLLVHGVVQESFQTNASLGYNMIVGPKGGKLQLVLNTVYYLSEPVENVPYEYYLDFLTAEEVQQLHSLEELAPVIERRNRELTVGQLEYFAARWLSDRMDKELSYRLLSHWWRERPADARRSDAEKHWNKYGQDKGDAIPQDAFVEYITVDLAEAPSDWAKEEFLDLARKTFRERFVGLVAAWRKGNLTDEQRKIVEQFALAEQFDELLQRDLLEGPYSREIDDKTPNLAIPVCLGDYYKQYRLVGTTPKMLDELEYNPDDGKKYEFAEGRNFKSWDDENGFFEAVVGAAVAREYDLKLGDKLVAAHGAAESDESDMHTESAFTVVGILRPSGTPNDRAVFVNMEGFYLMEGHAKKERAEDQTLDEAGAPAAGEANSENKPAADNDADEGDDDQHHQAQRKSPRKDPLPLGEREVTAILFRCKDPFASMAHSNLINEGEKAQVVMPVNEITVLFDMIVTPIQTLLLIVTALICVVSGMSILVSIYNSMTERKHEIAVMRALGAGRATVMTIVLLESIILSMAGGLLGWAAGHVLIASAGGIIEQRTGVSIGLFELAPGGIEFLLIPPLLLLAIIVGFLPALSAYRTDVAKSLQ